MPTTKALKVAMGIKGMPCNTILKVDSKRQIVVTCEMHPTFRVHLHKPVKTGTPDEVARAHRENPEVFS